jgi:hypothetical protein
LSFLAANKVRPAFGHYQEINRNLLCLVMEFQFKAIRQDGLQHQLKLGPTGRVRGFSRNVIMFGLNPVRTREPRSRQFVREQYELLQRYVCSGQRIAFCVQHTIWPPDLLGVMDAASNAWLKATHDSKAIALAPANIRSMFLFLGSLDVSDRQCVHSTFLTRNEKLGTRNVFSQ